MENAKVDEQLLKLESLFSQFDDICDVVAREIKNKNCPYSSDEVKKHISDMQDRERLLKIGIIGRVKAGKSSLINALLFNGQNVLPKAAIPMTAALTTIGYSDTFSAKVEFFSEDDIKKLKQQFEQYEKEIDNGIEDKKNKLVHLQQEQSAYQFDEEKVRLSIKNKIAQQRPSLKAAAELYEKIQSSNLKIENLLTPKKLEANSAEVLSKELYNYVGADGKYMPFTRTLHIGLPIDSLKDILVIDTPGLNDAVVSREKRTYDMLKECNVVFIVSPAGQFLTSQDMDLANRLTKRDGIQEIYVVASQIDLQLYGSEYQKYHGNLPKVINSIQTILKQQAENTLSNQSNSVLNNISSQLENHFFISSGVSQTLLTQPENQWDETALHTFGLLKDKYTDYFSDQNSIQTYLEMLSGQAPLLETIQSVRVKKDDILQTQIIKFTHDQIHSMKECIDLLVKHFTSKVVEVEQTELSVLTEKFKKLNSLCEEGIFASNNVFEDQIELLVPKLDEGLSSLIDEFMQDKNDNIDGAHSTERKAGLLNLLLETLFDMDLNIETMDARAIRTTLEGVEDQITSKLKQSIQKSLSSWRKTHLEPKLSKKICELLSENHIINEEKISSVCRVESKKIAKLPYPPFTPFPEELVKSNKLKGDEAKQYLKDVSDYLSSLTRDLRSYKEKILSAVENMSSFNIGEKLFDSLKAEMSQLNEMVKNKQTTVDKIHNFIKELNEVM